MQQSRENAMARRALGFKANIGIVNGSLVGYDVGYWSGFAGELTRLLDQNLDQADNDRKQAIIRRCCVNVEKAALAVPLDAGDETITDRLQELKSKSSILKSHLAKVTEQETIEPRAPVVEKSAHNIDWWWMLFSFDE